MATRNNQLQNVSPNKATSGKNSWSKFQDFYKKVPESPAAVRN